MRSVAFARRVGQRAVSREPNTDGAVGRGVDALVAMQANQVPTEDRLEDLRNLGLAGASARHPGDGVIVRKRVPHRSPQCCGHQPLGWPLARYLESAAGCTTS